MAFLPNTGIVPPLATGGGFTPPGPSTQLMLADGTPASALPSGTPLSDPDVSGLASVASKIAKSVATTKGDLLVATASAAIARQGVGTNGQVLTADSAQTNGLKWADVSASDATKLPLTGGTLSGNLQHSASIRIGPNTADGADNLSLKLGHNDGSRGASLELAGNEHTLGGQARIVLGISGTSSSFRVYGPDGTSLLFTVDGYGGSVSTTYLHSCGSLSVTGAATIAGAQQSAGVSLASGSAFTTIKSLSGIASAVIMVQATGLADVGFLTWDGTTLTAIIGYSTFPSSASPNTNQIGWQVSSGNLQAKNGTVFTRSVTARIFSLV